LVERKKGKKGERRTSREKRRRGGGGVKREKPYAESREPRSIGGWEKVWKKKLGARI